MHEYLPSWWFQTKVAILALLLLAGAALALGAPAFWALAVLIAAGGLVIMLMYRDWLFASRVRILTATMRRWTEGEPGTRSRLVTLSGEFGRLAKTFNAMVDALEEHLLERKQAERRERQRVVELDRACQQLQQTQVLLVQTEKLAAIGRLASSIAHEVKNPLAILLQGVAFLEQTKQPTPEQLTEVLWLMKDAVARADTIIKGLLTLARPASLQLISGNLHEAIQAALVLVEKDLASKRITVVKHLMPDPPPVLLDHNQMTQVFINLFSNAQQAMQDGGTFTIRTSPKVLTELTVGVGRRATDRVKLGEEVLVCDIQDSGCGIPEDKLERLFEPFFTTKSPGEGTGLGLAIVHGIIENHRGIIGVHSVEGQGTTFTIFLPVHRPATNA